METPRTFEGFLTEAIMRRISEKLGPMPTPKYNAIYSAVLGVLEQHLPEIRSGSTLTYNEFLMRGFC